MSRLQDFRVYSREDEAKLNAFCKEHNITRCGDEFYFDLDGVQYRISRYKIQATDPKVVHGIPKPKPLYQKQTIYFQAKRNMVRLIYNSLVAGYSEEDIKKELERRKAKAKIPPPPKEETPPGVEEVQHQVKTDIISDLLKRSR